MRHHPAAVVPASELLFAQITGAVANFPRKYKYDFGGKLRDWALDSVLKAREVWRLNRSKSEQLAAINELIVLNEQIKASIDVSWDLRLFSKGLYEVVGEQASLVGKQCGGWKREIEKHLKGQNPTAQADSERASILSTRDASPEAQG